MEYIQTLVGTNSIKVQPNDIPNKQDLVKKGVDFDDTNPIFVITMPTNDAIIRNIVLKSCNVLQIQVTFTLTSGVVTSPIQGSATKFPTEQFPTSEVSTIVIKVIKTVNGETPQTVTLSIIACAEGLTTIGTTSSTTHASTDVV